MRSALAVVTILLLASAPLGVAREGAPMDPALPEEGAARVLVHFAAPPTDADGRAVLAAGFAPLVRYEVAPILLATGPAARLDDLARAPGVVFVEHDAVAPWLLDTATTTIRAKPLWTSSHARWSSATASTHVPAGIDGRGIGIAIVDSGIDATHPDLLLKELGDATGAPWTTLANYKMIGRDSADLLGDSEPGRVVAANTLAVPLAHTDNTGGHGTHVAGAAAGKGIASGGKFKGAAPGAHLVGYGAGEALVISMGLAAFDHILLHHDELGIRIVSNSWGGPGDWQPQFAVTKAAQRLVDEGLVVVFAAGNNGGDGSAISSSTWANIPEVISVANWHEPSEFAHSTSSRGRKDLERTWPDFAAVGTNVVSAAAAGGPVTQYGNAQDMLLLGGELIVPVAPMPTTVQAGPVMIGPYASFTGTSMATPMVSGVVAMMLQADPTLSPDEVREIIRETARMPASRSYAAHGHAIGRGLVDASQAVAVALRMGDGLTMENALATATVHGTPASLNAASPDSGALRVLIDAPASAGAGEPVALRATAMGGDVFADYAYAWDLDGDSVADATGAAVTHAFASTGPRTVAVTASDGSSTAGATHALEVMARAVTLFADDMESGAGAWIVEDVGAGATASGWEHRSSAQGVYFGGFFSARSGSSFWHAGIKHTPATGGWAYAPAASSRLALSEPLDVSGATSVTLRFAVAGQSMAPLLVEARAPGGAWTEVSRVSGNILWGGGALFYEEREVPLAGLDAGSGALEVRFRHEARAPPTALGPLFSWLVFESGSYGGWALDDVRVEATY